MSGRAALHVEQWFVCVIMGEITNSLFSPHAYAAPWLEVSPHRLCRIVLMELCDALVVTRQPVPARTSQLPHGQVQVSSQRPSQAAAAARKG